MSVVMDRAGRQHHFDRIRFKMDEELLRQAASEVDDGEKRRAQVLFDRYCAHHLLKYGRNYEPVHFAHGRIKPNYAYLYEKRPAAIRITLEVRSGPLFDAYVGQQPAYAEASFQRAPRDWMMGAAVTVAITGVD